MFSYTGCILGVCSPNKLSPEPECQKPFGQPGAIMVHTHIVGSMLRSEFLRCTQRGYSPRPAQALCALIFFGCTTPKSSESTPEGSLTQQTEICDVFPTSSGDPLCKQQVNNRAAWDALAIPVEPVDQVASTKFLVPANLEARLPTLLINSFEEEFHLAFLWRGFPEWYAGLTEDEYDVLTMAQERREYYAGVVTEYVVSGGSAFVVQVWEEPSLGVLGCSDFSTVHAALSQAISLGPVSFFPLDPQSDRLAACGVPVFAHNFVVDFESYTQGEAYGTLRRFDDRALAARIAAGTLGPRDVVVLEQAPLDLDVIVAATITGTRQGELSHLNLRSASRGTPNCYDRTAAGRLAPWEGQLVRIECAKEGLTVSAATLPEAQAWWTQQQPPAVAIADAAVEPWPVTPLQSVPVATAEQRVQALQRYGAKGANLATLYQHVPVGNQFPAMLIPFGYEHQLREQLMLLGDQQTSFTLEETLSQWAADSRFQTDSSYRGQRLQELRAAITSTPCDSVLIAEIAATAQDVFGTQDRMLRFRSSSNAEDSIEFHGAGLYDSVSGCVADDLDGDEVGPSRCDAQRSGEKTVCDAVRRVWASLWNQRAFEERRWFGIDHRRAHMAILVNPQTPDERANIVAFTGNPTDPQDPRFLINAQIGEYGVVQAPVGVAPEKTLLEVDSFGNLSNAVRIRPSTEVDGGQTILSTLELAQLAGLLFDIQRRFPTPAGVPGVLLDTEWKLTAEGQLIIKQVRPFAPSASVF